MDASTISNTYIAVIVPPAGGIYCRPGVPAAGSGAMWDRRLLHCGVGSV